VTNVDNPAVLTAVVLKGHRDTSCPSSDVDGGADEEPTPLQLNARTKLSTVIHQLQQQNRTTVMPHK